MTPWQVYDQLPEAIMSARFIARRDGTPLADIIESSLFTEAMPTMERMIVVTQAIRENVASRTTGGTSEPNTVAALSREQQDLQQLLAAHFGVPLETLQGLQR